MRVRASSPIRAIGALRGRLPGEVGIFLGERAGPKGEPPGGSMVKAVLLFQQSPRLSNDLEWRSGQNPPVPPHDPRPAGPAPLGGGLVAAAPGLASRFRRPRGRWRSPEGSEADRLGFAFASGYHVGIALRCSGPCPRTTGPRCAPPRPGGPPERHPDATHGAAGDGPAAALGLQGLRHPGHGRRRRCSWWPARARTRRAGTGSGW